MKYYLLKVNGKRQNYFIKTNTPILTKNFAGIGTRELNEKGKKVFVKAMEERYDETFRHRSLGRNVSYKHLIKLECYKLLKDILGIEEYKPFKMYW